MKIKNLVNKLALAIVLGFAFASCTNDNNNNEIAKLPTFVETFRTNPNFSVLIKALDATGLSTTLASAGSYTVFAPTNAAFAAFVAPAGSTLPSAITDTTFATPLTPAQIAELRRILQYHVLSLGTKSTDLLAASYVSTFATAVGTTTLSLYVSQVSADVLLNGGAANGGAKVTTADIDSSNGIIHIIDNVLKLPKIVNFAVANPNLSTLVSVVTSGPTGPYGDQSAVLTALNGNGPLTVFAPLNSAFATATAAGGFITGANATPANISKIIRHHVSNGNLRATSVTVWAAANATISTLATPQTFLITANTGKISELPAITVPASNIRVINIQATNGVVHAIDRVLQPTLP